MEPHRPALRSPGSSLGAYHAAARVIRGDILRKQDQRTKLVSPASGRLVTDVLPEELDVEATHRARQ